MVGLGVAELVLLAMLTGAGVPSQIAFGNPMIWLAQSVVSRSVPGGAAAGLWLMAPMPSPPPLPPQKPTPSTKKAPTKMP